MASTPGGMRQGRTDAPLQHNTRGKIEYELQQDMDAFDRLPRTLRDALNYAHAPVSSAQVAELYAEFPDVRIIEEHLHEKVGYRPEREACYRGAHGNSGRLSPQERRLLRLGKSRRRHVARLPRPQMASNPNNVRSPTEPVYAPR